MKKKILLLLLFLISTVSSIICFSACGNSEEIEDNTDNNSTYVIDFYINNQKQDGSLSINNGADYELPHPNDITKDSSSNVYFIGWCLDEQCKNIISTDYIFTSDTKLYAKFEDINLEANKYTVDVFRV